MSVHRDPVPLLLAVLLVSGCGSGSGGNECDTAIETDVPIDTSGEADAVDSAEDTAGDVDAADASEDGLEDPDAADVADSDADAEEECIDSDGDGVCDSEDACPGSDDAADADLDGVPDGCDACAGHHDALDADLDGIPDGCDACPGYDDALDADLDTVPDGCDACPGSDDAADADLDGVPDGCDACAGHHDALDADLDGVPDGCDACPGYDDAQDADADTVPDACDACPGHDDALDADLDAVPDACDVCPGGDDLADVDADGIPDSCPLDVLVVEGYGSADLEAFLVGWGFTVTRIDGSLLTSSFDYGPYDVVATMFDSTMADAAHLASESAAGNVGQVMHRSDSLVGDFDMCASGFWQSGEFAITDATHFITEGYAVGILPLDFTYKSDCNAPTASVTVLGTSTDPSLVVHDTYRRVVTPYYGHTDGMPWNDDAAKITWRSYMWASGVGAQ